jgi:plastocyanin
MHAFAALALLIAQTGAGTPAAAAAAPGSGKVSGKVTLSGLAPKLANLPVTRDIKVCGASKPDEALVVGEGGGVKNAVLWIVDGPQPKKGDKHAFKLDQKGCQFVPHVLAMPAGSTLDVVNSEKLFHNAHGRDGDKTVFNFAMPVPDYVIPKQLKTPGLIRVTCEVHPWMRGWIDVLPTTAFAVTDDSGSFTIAGVPPGKHKVRLWHERLGDREQDVEVASGQTASLDVQLSPR